MLLTRVKTTLAWHAHRRTARILDGEYASVFHGHSLDFDDLRQYVPGDEVRDIDWRATARNSTPLVRRYVAGRQHRLCLVTDVGRDAGAVTSTGESKRDLAVHLCGLAGYLAIRHGDDVHAVFGNDRASERSRVAGTEAHLEHLLRGIHSRASGADEGSDLSRQLAWLARTERNRMIVLIVADDRALGDAEERLLRRLRVQHELMWITVTDANLEAVLPRGARDVDATFTLPPALAGSTRLWDEYRAAEAGRRAHRSSILRRLGVPHVEVDSHRRAVPAMLRLLERQRRARR